MNACRRLRNFGRCYIHPRASFNRANVETVNSTGKSPFSQNARHRADQGLCYSNDIFEFTRGRFVSNEAEEIRHRHVSFNAPELARRAANAVNSRYCVRIDKCPDGLYNKALLLTMDDGKQVIAKIPNPNAGRPHFTTASEVATMDFVRNILGTPAPTVYAWSSRSETDPIGAEYIIMEKTQGVPLGQKWAQMGIEARLAVVKTIVTYKKAWMSCPFSQFGSLYYHQNLDGQEPHNSLHIEQSGNRKTASQFKVGPSTGREFFDDGRAAVDLDRGPWNTIEDYCSAIGHREKACIQSAARLPKSPVTLCGPGTYRPTRERKLKAVECYLAILEYLLPTEIFLSRPFLWHADLHLENIFVDPQDPTQVLGLIDWQSSEIAPLFYHARQPYFLDHNGQPTCGLERPRLPDNMSQLDQAAQVKAKAIYLDRALEVLYRTLVHGSALELYRAVEFQTSTSFDLLVLARNLFVDGEATYLARLVELQKSWQHLPGVQARGGGVPFPLSFSGADVAGIEEDASAALRGMQAMQAIQESMGDLFPEKGIVRAEQYNEAKDALRQLKVQIMREFAKNEHEKAIWNEEWPFDD